MRLSGRFPLNYLHYRGPIEIIQGPPIIWVTLGHDFPSVHSKMCIQKYIKIKIMVIKPLSIGFNIEQLHEYPTLPLVLFNSA